jgi:hypothetical protein
MQKLYLLFSVVPYSMSVSQIPHGIPPYLRLRPATDAPPAARRPTRRRAVSVCDVGCASRGTVQ